MELSQLKTFIKIVSEKGFARAAFQLGCSQPAISMALQRLESELGERLVDRNLKELALTDAGKIVYEYAQRMEFLHGEMVNALTELRFKHSGKVTVGANENGVLYVSNYISEFRQHYPRVKVEIRRSFSRNIPGEVLENKLDLGVVSYKPNDPGLGSLTIYTDALAFTVYPEHRLAKSKEIAICDLGAESFIAHNVSSPYRQLVCDAFQQHGVPLHIDLEMPTVDTVKQMIRKQLGVSFLPRICIQEELANGSLVEVAVRDFTVSRTVVLVYPVKRALSYAAAAFVEMIKECSGKAEPTAPPPPPHPKHTRFRAPLLPPQGVASAPPKRRDVQTSSNLKTANGPRRDISHPSTPKQ